MRRVRKLPIIVLAVLMTSCADRLQDSGSLDSQGVGEVVLNLSADAGTLMKSEDTQEGVSVDAFSVEIFNSSSIRLYCQKFEQAKAEAIPLNSGEYRLLAKYGDTLGVGFDKPFYLADKSFTVHPQTKETVEAVAKLANVKVAVEFGDNLKAAYPDFYAVVRHTSTQVKSSLKFLKDETRKGYIPGGDLVVELYADPEGNGQWKYYEAPAQTFSPNDFVTFRIDKGTNYGNLVINVLVDTSAEQIDKIIEIPLDAVSAPAPAVEAVGFTQGHFPVKQGDRSETKAYFSVAAPGTLASCTLEIDSPYLASIGVPSTVDLLSDTAADALAPAGIWFGGDLNAMAVDLSALAPVLANTGEVLGTDLQLASLTLTAVDANGRTGTASVAYDLLPEGSITILPGMVWAKKMTGFYATLTSSAGDPAKMSLQYSSDALEWSELPVTLSGRTIQAQDLTGLAPETEYSFRLLYDGLYTLDTGTVTTEAAAQVGNAGFEQWTATPYETNQHTAYVYYPYLSGSDKWWDVNSMVSMRSDITVLYYCFKCMPTVTYGTSSVHSGNAAAQVSTINIGNSNSMWATTGTWYVGELFIGSADSDGNKVSSGHPFASRPSAVTFWYRFSAYSSSDRFGAEAQVLAEDGTVLASASISDGPQTDSWTMMTLPLNYTVTDRKAASISISFKASTSGSHSCDVWGEIFEIAGQTGTDNYSAVKLSSMLRLDDVELVY
ncbi:MAG: DUF4493 domain-containing protein [Candidatus Cryptobacteroides sp.]